MVLFEYLVFSPAPTLLEMQQENLSRRLMSYKSLHGLSSQIETIKSTETALENGKFCSIPIGKYYYLNSKSSAFF